ncbi:hypothetical protein [Flavobacterium mesophilum]|uniref:hypothetical protein n=1 Tax=Flavobacterium mesophilum TaxID=3143495 RepID=UPI0031D79B2F
MGIDHNRIKVSDLETNQANKILTTNEKGEIQFSDLDNIKIDSYNGLDYNISGKALDARQGKVLNDLISDTSSAILSNTTALASKENSSNKSNDIGDLDSTTKFPVFKVITDWVSSIFKKKYVFVVDNNATTYTLKLSDGTNNTLIRHNNTAAITEIIPTNATVAFPIGTEIKSISTGVGLRTVVPASGVTIINNVSLISAQNQMMRFLKTDVNTWIVTGDVGFEKDIKLTSYLNTRNDGQLSTNKVLSTDANGNLKMYFISTSPAPFLQELQPDAYLPSTTVNIILKGAFFTPTMTVAITGQTVNYITFISDNEVHVNVSIGNTEGSFPITLNNGLSATFNNKILVILGDPYVPIQTDYIGLTTDINGTQSGNLYTLNYLKNTAVAIELDRNNPKLSIPYNQNFSIRFNVTCPQENGTKSIDYQPKTVVGVYRKTDNSQLIAIAPHATSYDEYNFFFNDSQVAWQAAGSTGVVDNTLSSYKYRWGHTYEIRRVGTVVEYRIDNVVKHTINTTIAEDMYVKITMMPFHVTNIKVIKLNT